MAVEEVYIQFGNFPPIKLTTPAENSMKARPSTIPIENFMEDSASAILIENFAGAQTFAIQNQDSKRTHPSTISIENGVKAYSPTNKAKISTRVTPFTNRTSERVYPSTKHIYRNC
jgi:hypothetical protein